MLGGSESAKCSLCAAYTRHSARVRRPALPACRWGCGRHTHWRGAASAARRDGGPCAVQRRSTAECASACARPPRSEPCSECLVPPCARARQRPAGIRHPLAPWRCRAPSPPQEVAAQPFCSRLPAPASGFGVQRSHPTFNAPLHAAPLQKRARPPPPGGACASRDVPSPQPSTSTLPALALRHRSSNSRSPARDIAADSPGRLPPLEPARCTTACRQVHHITPAPACCGRLVPHH